MDEEECWENYECVEEEDLLFCENDSGYYWEDLDGGCYLEYETMEEEECWENEVNEVNDVEAEYECYEDEEDGYLLCEGEDYVYYESDDEYYYQGSEGSGDDFLHVEWGNECEEYEFY
jgi:hypothetical protein